MTDLLTVSGVSKAFAQVRGLRIGGRQAEEQVQALDQVSMTIAKHETLALVGESGSGKSTLARVIVGLVEPDSGTVSLDGEDLLGGNRAGLAGARGRIQLVFQDPYASLNPRRTVSKTITEPALVHGIIEKTGRAAFVKEMLERVRLPVTSAEKLPRELSGGQRQRVAIARALAVRPELLIADEAISALDVSVQAQILNLFEELRSELGLTMLFISHQLPVVSHIADRVAVMYLGRIVEIGDPADLFARPGHPYTQGLIDAQPGRRRQRAPIKEPAEISLDELLSQGCAYRDRCPLASGVCSVERPPLLDVAPRHRTACHYSERLLGQDPHTASASYTPAPVDAGHA